LERSRRTGVRLPASPRDMGDPCPLTRTGVVSCYPPGGRPPGPPDVRRCAPHESGPLRLTKAGRCASRKRAAAPRESGPLRLAKAGRCAPRESGPLRASRKRRGPCCGTRRRLNRPARYPRLRRAAARIMIMSIPHRICCGISMKTKIRAIMPLPPRERRSSPRPSSRTVLTRTAHH